MLHINELKFSIGRRVLLDNATMAVPEGIKAGLVGRNGAGKTTLFRLINGSLAPETGTISMPRGYRVGEVAQEAPGGPESLIDTVIAADRVRARLLREAERATDPHRIAEIHVQLADIGAHSAEARAGAILAGLGFDAGTQKQPCSSLSGGWRMRVALAAVLFSEPDVLLLDEPTNYLDLEGTMWLEGFLARYRHTVIVISHDRDLLDKMDMIVHLEAGKLVAYRGGYSSFDRQRREKLVLQGKMRKKQEEQRAHMLAFIERFKAKASKARQAQSRMKALEKLEPIAAISEETVYPFHFPDPAKKLAPPIMTMEDASVGYAPGHPVLKKLSLRIDEDDRIALLGQNGNGKSTFAKLIAGKLEPMSGNFRRADRMTTAYFAQHQLDELNPDGSAYDHVRALMEGAPESKIRARVGAMGFPTQKMDTPARDLSGGEKARLMLGLAAFAGPDLLILDEPTNHLDIDSREALTQALADYAGAVILISHDRHLVEASVDHLWLVADGTVKSFDGDMDDYRRLVLDRSSAGPAKRADAPAASNAGRRRDAAQKRAELAPLRKRIKDAESLMERLQESLKEFDARLADPDLYARDPSGAAFVAKDRADAARRLAETEEQWLELSGEYEEATAAG
jgi:ATP-binding cassette subfamily F protein 3